MAGEKSESTEAAEGQTLDESLLRSTTRPPTVEVGRSERSPAAAAGRDAEPAQPHVARNRRRAEYAALPVLRDLLPVVDNIDRAIEAAEKAGEAENLLAGFRLVKQQLHTILGRNTMRADRGRGRSLRPEFPSGDFAATLGRRPGRPVIDGHPTGLQTSRPRRAAGPSHRLRRPGEVGQA